MGLFSGRDESARLLAPVSFSPFAMACKGEEPQSKTSSAPNTSPTSRIAFVSTTSPKEFPYFPPPRIPFGPLSSCSIIHPASSSVVPYVAAKLALTCGATLATKILLSPVPSTSPSTSNENSEGAASSAFCTSAWDCRETRTASAEVTQPEQARQSVREICAGGGGTLGSLSSVVTS